MTSLDVSDEAQQDRVKQFVGDAPFKNLAMREKLDRQPEADTPLDAFMSELMEINCLHLLPLFPKITKEWTRDE